jgi:hypothetical protein
VSDPNQFRRQGPWRKEGVAHRLLRSFVSAYS